MHRQRRRLLIQIDGASVHAGVSGDLTVIEVEDTVLVNCMHRAALFHGLVAGNLATPHDNLRHLIGISAQADGAAPSACGVIVDLCAAVHIDRAPAHQNGAAVQTGGITGDLRIAGNIDGATAAHINSAAAGIVAAHGRCIAGDCAAGHINSAAGSGEERAAILGCVVLDNAAVHIETAAGGVRLIFRKVLKNSAAVVPAIVAGDFTTVHIEHAILVIQSDGTTAATAGNFTAGELAAEHVQRAGIEVNAHTAPAGGSALDGAAAPTVTEDKPAAVFDLNLICTIAGVSLAVQAQVKRRAIHHKIAVDGGIVCQVNIGGIVVISNTVRAVPRRIGHIRMAGMIPCTDATATDAMKMRFIRKLYLRLVNDFRLCFHVNRMILDDCF